MFFKFQCHDVNKKARDSAVKIPLKVNKKRTRYDEKKISRSLSKIESRQEQVRAKLVKQKLKSDEESKKKESANTKPMANLYDLFQAFQ